MTSRRRRSRGLASPTRTARALLAGIALATLAGCGQKGPLVLPDEAANRARTAPTSTAPGGGERAESGSAASGRRTTDDDDEQAEDGADGG